jgi:hypothetical protein
VWKGTLAWRGLSSEKCFLRHVSFLPLNATPCFVAHGVTYLRGFSLCRKVRRCRVFDEFSLYWTCLRNFFDDHGMRHQTMFEFLKKGPSATPAYEVATALWIHGVSDDPMTRGLAAAASEENSLSEAIVLDEAVYFMSFATDLTIHRVFKSDASVEHALREEFLDHVRGYARYQQITPCPVGDWLVDSNIWEIRSPGRDTGNPVQHLADRFDLYAATMRRPSERGRSLPVVGILCALCNTLDAVFMLTATEFFIKHSINTQDFLRRIRIKS